jgi:hypothetical protein
MTLQPKHPGVRCLVVGIALVVLPGQSQAATGDRVGVTFSATSGGGHSAVLDFGGVAESAFAMTTSIALGGFLSSHWAILGTYRQGAWFGGGGVGFSYQIGGEFQYWWAGPFRLVADVGFGAFDARTSDDISEIESNVWLGAGFGYFPWRAGSHSFGIGIGLDFIPRGTLLSTHLSFIWQFARRNSYVQP